MPEYNPLNEVIKKQYEEALLHGKGRDPKTVRAAWNNITLFEKFTVYADFKTFDAEQAKMFKSWLEKQKNRDGELLGISTIRSTLNSVREFFEWLAIHPHYVKKIDGRAVQYLRLSDNANRAARASREKTPPKVEELEAVLRGMPHSTDIEKRDRALFAFTIITIARDDAIITMKVKDFDPVKKVIWQNPRHVRTKYGKGIVTRILGNIMPFAEDIFLEWVKYIKEDLKFKANDPLFPKTLVETCSENMTFKANGLSRQHWANAQPVRDIFKNAFEITGLPYYNPHLLRNTICKWGLKNLSQYEFKALSQNMGHENAMVSYNSYAKLSEDEQIEALSNIGAAHPDLKNVPTGEILKEIARRTGNKS